MKLAQSTVLLIVTILAVSLATVESGDDVRFQLDTIADKGYEWSFVDNWFIYGDTVGHLKDHVTKRHYPIPRGFWNSFRTKANGIWALFHHMKEMPRPSTTFSFLSESTSFDRIDITYLMYGKAHINVTTDMGQLIAKPIYSNCFKVSCAKGFRTESVKLTTTSNAPYYSFIVGLNATDNESFILIDKITPVPVIKDTPAPKNNPKRIPHLSNSFVQAVSVDPDSGKEESAVTGLGWLQLVLAITVSSVFLVMAAYKIVIVLKDRIKKFGQHILLRSSDDSVDVGATKLIISAPEEENGVSTQQDQDDSQP